MAERGSGAERGRDAERAGGAETAAIGARGGAKRGGSTCPNRRSTSATRASSCSIRSSVTTSLLLVDDCLLTAGQEER